MSQGTAVKIIDITGENGSDSVFKLQKDELSNILSKIPSNQMKVSVVSIVGAFRTGKSFMLNFFLRYLRYLEQKHKEGKDDEILADDSESWFVKEGEELAEGNLNLSQKTSVDEPGGSFAWRGGNERMTTGIWMWSEPFIIHSTRYDEDIAVLLMDTQGMFDNQTTMTLTAQIFGLSTLVSSFQIYNVEKRIGEDNLQHLALFSEYGRMAVSEENKISTGKTPRKAPGTPGKAKPTDKPFQRLQFLVRDYQNFEEEFDEQFYQKPNEEKQDFFDKLKSSTAEYLKSVISDKGVTDLQNTRNQINRCFNKVDCYLLPHPGSAATKKTFSGSIQLLDSFFRVLLNSYVREVFSNMEAKQINHRFITGLELLSFFDVYVSMFQAGSKSFPQAMTMLEATAEANNRNAHALALAMYKKGMDAKLSPTRGQAVYMKDESLQALHNTQLDKSLDYFDDIATMGSEEAIDKHRQELLTAIEDARVRYFKQNALSNPFRDIELYFFPTVIGISAFIGSKVVDNLCSTDFCENTEDALERVYMLLFFLMLVMAWRHVRNIYNYAYNLLPLLLNKPKTA